MHRIAPRAVRQALLFVLATSLGFAPGAAVAAEKEKAQKKSDSNSSQTKVVLGAFTGPRSAGVRGWAETGLENADSVELVGGEDAAGVAHGSSDSDYASVASGAGAAALVVGRVNLQKKVGWSLTLWVHNGADGKLIEKLTVRGGLLPGLRRKLEGSLGEVLAPALAKATGPSNGTDTAASTEGAEPVQLEEEGAAGESLDQGVVAPDFDDTSTASTTSASTVQGPSPADVRVGLRLYKRDFAYTGTVAEAIPGQPAMLGHSTAAGSPMFMFSGNLYPIAFFSTGALAHLGLMVGYEYGFLTKTALPDPADPLVDQRLLPQTHIDTFFGVRYRLMLGDQEIVPVVKFGKHSFKIEDDKYPYPELLAAGDPNPYRDAIPDVTYTYVDVGLEPRFVFGKFSVGLRGTYRIVNDMGGLQQSAALDENGQEVDPYDNWFPLAQGVGVSAGLHLGYQLSEVLELQLGGDMTRYAFNFNHIPTAQERMAVGRDPLPVTRIAGGATDTYVSGFLALAVRFPGGEMLGDPGSDAGGRGDSSDSSGDADADVIEDPEDEDVEELDF